MVDCELTNPYLYGVHNCSYVPICKSKFSIGRSIPNSLVIEDFKISKNHCIIEKINKIWYITDNCSNRILVNDKKIPKRSRHVLSDGDVIKLSAALTYVFNNKCNTSSIEEKNEDKIIQTINASIPSTEGSTPKNNWECTNCINENTTDSDSVNTDESEASTDQNLSNYNPLLRKRRLELHNKLPEHLEDQLHCTICAQYIIDANKLNCAHTFCKLCIQNWRKTNKNCPICSKNIITIEAYPVLDTFITEILASSTNGDKEKHEQIVAIRKQQENVLYLLNQERTLTNNINRKRKLHSNNTINDILDDLECVICKELFINAFILNCSHIFCKYCIEEWQKKNKYCPICREEILSFISENKLDNIITKIMESATDDIKNDRNLVIERRKKEIKASLFNKKICEIKRLSRSVQENSRDEDSEWASFIRSLHR